MAEHSSARPGDLRGAASVGYLDQELQEAHPVWRHRQHGSPAREEEGCEGAGGGRNGEAEWGSRIRQTWALSLTETLRRTCSVLQFYQL